MGTRERINVRSPLRNTPLYDWDNLVREDRVHRLLYTDRSVFDAEMIQIFWDSETRVLAGWAGYRFYESDRNWKISVKQVNLINRDQCIKHHPVIHRHFAWQNQPIVDGQWRQEWR